jgi:hypothetical protein
MKPNRSILIAFGLLVIIASVYRIWDGRPFGFAPQIAMAIFGGAVISNKKLAFVLPLLSMFLSDLLYQLLYIKGLSTIPGFYEGQLVNYCLFAGLTVFGFAMKRISVPNVLGFAISGSLLFFIFSNCAVWLGGGGWFRAKTVDGLVLCYTDALAFYREYGLIEGFWGNFIFGDVFFSGLLFGSYLLMKKVFVPEGLAAARA